MTKGFQKSSKKAKTYPQPLKKRTSANEKKKKYKSSFKVLGKKSKKPHYVKYLSDCEHNIKKT